MIKEIFKNLLKKKGYKLFPSSTIAMDLRQINNLIYYGKLYSQIKNIPGNIVECGVGRGRSFLYLSSLAFFENNKRNLFGFDSFEGFPEPKKEDNSVRNPKKGEWSGTSTMDILNALKTAGLSEEYLKNQIHLIKGFFDKTLSSYSSGPIALLHIDADLYDSYKCALETLYPKVSKGGLVLFDEYGTEEWPGATKAVNDFFGEKSKNIKYDSIVKKYYYIKE
ncbi:MAG: hypothetical protein EXS49_01625 [Candidatus Pacebacteria bacterium]|nr:hypothetical protein [Candidatus Paceibacterota bacterium]